MGSQRDQGQEDQSEETERPQTRTVRRDGLERDGGWVKLPASTFCTGVVCAWGYFISWGFPLPLLFPNRLEGDVLPAE